METWFEDELVGGLYGVSVGRIFCGESMFSRKSEASKVALVALVRRIDEWGFRYVDAQVATPLLTGFGAEIWPRSRFLKVLKEEVEAPDRCGSWALDEPIRLNDGI